MRPGIFIPRDRIPRVRGFTLIELMITVVVVAIGVALAVPAWDNLVQKRLVTSAAEEITSFLVYSQSEAIKRNEEVTVTIKRNAGGTTWCIGAINELQKEVPAPDLDHCECDVAPSDDAFCSFDGQPQFLSQASFADFTMDNSAVAGIDNNDFHFNIDPIRGIKMNDDGATVDRNVHRVSLLSDNTHYSLQIDVSATGRTRICSPDATKKVPGFKTC